MGRKEDQGDPEENREGPKHAQALSYLGQEIRLHKKWYLSRDLEGVEMIRWMTKGRTNVITRTKAYCTLAKQENHCGFRRMSKRFSGKKFREVVGSWIKFLGFYFKYDLKPLELLCWAKECHTLIYM